MNYEKQWKALKVGVLQQMKACENGNVDGTYYEAMADMLAAMNEMEKPRTFTIVEAYDPIAKKTLFKGHLDDLNPSKERLERFESALLDRKLSRYVTYEFREGNIPAKEWFETDLYKTKMKEIGGRIEWKTHEGTWK